MLPGADWNFMEKTVWTESITTSDGFTRAISSRMRSMQVSDSRYSGASPIPRRSPRLLI